MVFFSTPRSAGLNVGYVSKRAALQRGGGWVGSGGRWEGGGDRGVRP